MVTYFVWSKSENIVVYARTTRYETQIAQAQEFEREAMKLVAFANTFAETSAQYRIQMEKAEKAHREGQRYFQAAHKGNKHA